MNLSFLFQAETIRYSGLPLKGGAARRAHFQRRDLNDLYLVLESRFPKFGEALSSRALNEAGGRPKSYDLGFLEMIFFLHPE